MKPVLKSSVSTGIVFGIILIFLILIGFQATGAELIGGMLGNENAGQVVGLSPAMLNMLIFFGVIEIWAGYTAARRIKSLSKLATLVGALITGAVTGLLISILAYSLGTLNVAGVNMSTYLAELLPASVLQFTLNKSPIQSGLFYLLFFTLAGGMGGLLRIVFLSTSLPRNVSSRWTQARTNFMARPGMQKVKNSKFARPILYGLLFLIVFLTPLLLGQYWNYTLGTVGIYVLLGLGLNIVVGFAGLLDLGYVAFFAIGAYSMALMTAPAPHHLMWSFWVVIPIGLVLAATAGIFLGIPVLRMRGDYLAIVTLGFGEIIRILSSSDLLSSFSGGPRGVPNIGQPTLFGRPFNSNLAFLYMIAAAVLIIIFVTLRLKDSHVGRAWEAMREDETVARAMGINTLKYKLLAFSIGAAFAGLGGALFASRNQFTGPDDHTLMVSINVLALVIVGGMGSIPGVIAGAFVLKGLPEVLRQLQDYRVLTFGALLVVMMIIRPEGLIPSKRRRMELHETAESPPTEQGESSEVK
jgi:branched-chain amino acid transport system permease protein